MTRVRENGVSHRKSACVFFLKKKNPDPPKCMWRNDHLSLGRTKSYNIDTCIYQFSEAIPLQLLRHQPLMYMDWTMIWSGEHPFFFSFTLSFFGAVCCFVCCCCCFFLFAADGLSVLSVFFFHFSGNTHERSLSLFQFQHSRQCAPYCGSLTLSRHTIAPQLHPVRPSRCRSQDVSR